jgi:hypothetical protein
MKNRPILWPRASELPGAISTCGSIGRGSSLSGVSQKTAGFAQSMVASIAIAAPTQNSLDKTVSPFA